MTQPDFLTAFTIVQWGCLLVALVIGVSVLYIMRYWKIMGKWLRLIKFLIVITIVLCGGCGGLESPPDDLTISGDGPILLNPDTLKAASDILYEELAWRAGIMAFLNGTNQSNLTVWPNTTRF